MGIHVFSEIKHAFKTSRYHPRINSWKTAGYVCQSVQVLVSTSASRVWRALSRQQRLVVCLDSIVVSHNKLGYFTATMRQSIAM